MRLVAGWHEHVGARWEELKTCQTKDLPEQSSAARLSSPFEGEEGGAVVRHPTCHVTAALLCVRHTRPDVVYVDDCIWVRVGAEPPGWGRREGEG